MLCFNCSISEFVSGFEADRVECFIVGEGVVVDTEYVFDVFIRLSLGV